MATYAVGDVQGCDRELVALLEKIAFGSNDELWLAGDLINRGPDSLSVLRRLYAMADQCRIVLGNHDLHFLAILFGGHSPNRTDTLGELLQAEDVQELGHWLRQQPLLQVFTRQNHALVHAGIPPMWSYAEALSYAAEVERVIQGNGDVSYVDFFREMYGNEPTGWREDLKGMDRLRVITNFFTRMRLLDPSQQMNFSHKGALEGAPAGLQPWYRMPVAARPSGKILFGHWAALEGYTGVADAIALDTGCVWGRTLTAYCVETGEFITQAALRTV